LAINAFDALETAVSNFEMASLFIASVVVDGISPDIPIGSWILANSIVNKCFKTLCKSISNSIDLRFADFENR
jgi:hypothetical protein